MSVVNPSKSAWKTHQVIDDRNPPTLNTLHEVFSAKGGVKLLNIAVIQTNTPTNMEEIDIVITLDGTPYTYDASAIGGLLNNTEYSVIIWATGVTAYPAYTVDITTLRSKVLVIDAQAGPPPTGQGKPIERHAIKVEVRQTSAIAAAARIRTKVTYAVLEAL